jgi:hypothetical protein
MLYSMNEPKREFLRHTLATLAYRGGKVIRETPAGFADFDAGAGSRTPIQILAHIGDLLSWILTQARGEQAWSDVKPGTWDVEVKRFFDGLERLDAYLASEEPLAFAPEQLFQAAIADALTHIGQLAMLRRMAGLPVRAENYFRADIKVGRVGKEQTKPKREF